MTYKEKVEKFRGYIFENIDFLVAYSNHKYLTEHENKEIPRGKIVDCINSANDWLTVAAEGLDNFSLTTESESMACLQIIQLITYIHIVFLSIKDINKVIERTNKAEPFYDSKNIFSKYPFEMTDNDYFRNIRSAFGEHSTDLHFKENSAQEKETHYFTSWPVMRQYRVDDNLTYDFYLLLYEKENEGSQNVFGFRYKDLYAFLDRNIEYLTNIIEKIEIAKTNFAQSMIQEKMPSIDNINDKIDMLIYENEKRLSNDYYEFILKNLQLFYKQNYNNDDFRIMMDKYKIKLFNILIKLELNIQNMIVEDIEDNKLLYFNCHDSNINYEFSNLVNNIFSSYKPVFYNVLYEYINEKTNIAKTECELLNDEELYCILIIISNSI